MHTLSLHTYFTSRVCLFIFLLFFAGLQATAFIPPRPNESDNSLAFTENKNQWPAPVKFAAGLPGGRMFLKNNGFTFLFYNLPDHHHQHQEHSKKSSPNEDKIKGHVYNVTFLNASAAVTTSGSEKAEGYSNYFIGNDKSKWASEVLSYGQVNYHQLYPGIDMQLYQYNAHLKYDFLVKPGADPATIKMQYTGPDKLWLENGALHIKTSVRSITEQKPYAYQIINGRETEVPCSFRLEKNTVTFYFPKGYDKNQELIIDPVLVYSSYSGSSGNNWGFTATYDSQGNMYSGGVAFEPGFPVTTGAFDTSFNNAVATNFFMADIAIIKYNTAATGAASRLYATYIGGNQNDVPHSLVVNSNDDLLILGTTGSDNYPVSSNAYDKTFAGGSSISPLGSASYLSYTNGSDLVITKLSSNGTTLLGSTYLGGTSNDGLLALSNPLVKNYGDQFRGDITVDRVDNVYITSSTSSPDFPLVVKSRWQSQVFYNGGQTDAIIAAFNPNLSQLIWSEFYGGSGADAAYSIQAIGNGQEGTILYIAGGTTSPDLDFTWNTFKPNYQGSVDGFVASISITTSQPIYATYLGTTSYDQAYFVQLDANRNIYVLGQTQGQYPVSPGVYSNANSRQFIHKLNPNLNTSIFSTTFGSTNGLINISPTAFLVDDCERIYACGWGGGTNTSGGYIGSTTYGMTVTGNAFQATTDGADFYLIQLSKDATRLDYATYFGGVQTAGESGDHVDGGTSRFDKRGFVYQAVCASCNSVSTSSFPTTPGAWSNNRGPANCNNAAFKFDFEIEKVVPGSSQRVCAGAAPFQLTGATPAGGTWSGPGVTAGGLFTPSAALAGVNVLTYTVTVGNCVNAAQKTITVKPVPDVSFTGLHADYCLDAAPATLTGQPAGGIFSGPGITGNIFDPAVAGAGNHTVSYSFTTADSCTVSASRQVVINARTTLNAKANIPECVADRSISGLAPLTVQFTNSTQGAGTFLWAFGDGATSAETEPAHTYAQPGTYIVTLTSAPGSPCAISATVATIIIPETRQPNIITPNNDNRNDVFQPLLTCLPATLKVYNRWGSLVHEQKNYDSTWQGKNLPDGLYYYLLTDTSGQSWKGWVEIVR